MKEKKAYIFFNCDEQKDPKSMNVMYNNTVYGDTKKARKELLAKIEEEIAAGKVHADEAALEHVRKEVLDGDPAAASASLQFGAVIALSII
mgnify:CR=1 FL=1